MLLQKQFDNLIAEWSKDRPWVEINRQIKQAQKHQDDVDNVLNND